MFPQQNYDPTILLYQQQRKAIYYSLSDSEIETYSQFGWLITFCLTFFGLGGGLSGGCVIALIQTPPSQLISSSLFWFALVSGLFSLILAGILLYFQRTQKKMWNP
jgi:hypothetical protein